MRRPVLVLLAILAAPALVSGARAAPVDRAAKVEALLEPIRRRHDLPALAAAVVTVDRPAVVGAVGMREYGGKTPVTANDQFHLGSCTKAMTATLIGMLVEEGRLSWDTTLAHAFPDLADRMDPAYRDVTVEQLLAHRSGISGESWPRGKTFLDMHRLPGSPREQRRAYVEMILREPPESAPGAKFLYSNRNYALLGAIAERVTGVAWEDLMRRRLFRPLGMKTAGFGAMGTPGKEDQPWQHVLRDGRHAAIPPGPLSDNPAIIGPGGTVHCSLGDWGRFIAVHLRGEKGRVGLLKSETIRRLHTPPFGGDYMGGWIVTERDWGGGKVLTHNGSNNQNFAVVWMAPLRGFAVLVATNQGGDEAAKACDEAAWALIQAREKDEGLR